MSFGSKMREIMFWKHKTQVDVFKATGISRNTLSQYSKDLRSPTLLNAQKIADALGVSLWTLLNGDDMAVDSDDLTAEERKLVNGYRHLDPELRKAVQHVVEAGKPRP